MAGPSSGAPRAAPLRARQGRAKKKKKKRIPFSRQRWIKTAFYCKITVPMGGEWGIRIWIRIIRIEPWDYEQNPAPMTAPLHPVLLKYYSKDSPGRRQAIVSKTEIGGRWKCYYLLARYFEKVSAGSLCLSSISRQIELPCPSLMMLWLSASIKISPVVMYFKWYSSM